MSTVLAVLLAVSGGTWLDVPFTRQAKDGCGSAAIWMLMSYWRTADTPAVAEIHHAVFSPEAGGVYASTMERYFASHGFRALVLSAEWPDIQIHLNNGQPLIASIESNARGLQLHYVVIAGIDDAASLVFLNDPADRKLRVMRRSEFEKRWKATGNWTLLVLPSDENPKRPAADVTGSPGASAPGSPDLVAASTAFRNEEYSQAKRFAFKALSKDPKDPTTNELLATIYYLQNNFEASLKYWNRVEKPKIHDLRMDPPTAVDPLRLERNFEFSRGSMLTLDQYRRTARNLDGSDAFSTYAFDLLPADSNSFDMTFRSTDRTGWHYLSAVAGLPFQTARSGYTNIGGNTTNLEGLVRWDSRKERLALSLSAPAGSSGSTRWMLEADGRREEWDRLGTQFLLRKIQATFGLQSQLGSRGSWSSGIETGTHQHQKTLGYLGDVEFDILRVPERRVVLTTKPSVRLRRFDEERSVKADEDLHLRWIASASGNDWATSIHLRGGWASKNTPVDEAFALGIDRDDPEHLLRAHSATHDGRKGAAIISNRYALLNAEVEKTVRDFGLVRFTAAPFIDIARTNQWFIDTGIDFKVRVASSATFSFSIGRDLQAGKTVVFAR